MKTDSLFGIHLQALQIRGQRAEILAQNMANADTPGFKARDVEYSKVISRDSAFATQLRTSQSGHIGNTGTSGQAFQLKYRTPLQPSLDGNTVDIQTERAEFMRNALMYQTSLRFINGRITGLMTAIRGE